MEIPGLSTQAYKYQYNQNRYKYNGIEYDSAFGLDYYEAKYRDYDAQIGRFTQIDPKVESAEGWSVYSGMLDNPVLNSDPLGDSSIVSNWLDSHGWGFREPTSEQWRDHPVQSSIREVGYLGASLFGFPQTEQSVRTITDSHASKTDKVLAVVNSALSTTRGEGGEETPMEGTGEIQPPKGAANPEIAKALSVGKEAHNDFANTVQSKEGWTANPRLIDPATGNTVIPDAVSPSGHPVELKPNTPSGRAKGETQLPKYERATGNKGRVVYYDPLKWLKDTEIKK